MPTVSILIPAYKADYLGRAILSAQRQTFEDIEILVGDDTPDAALQEVVSRFEDPRIRYFHHGFQNGTRNSQALWEHARGQYVKFLSGDDMLMPASVQTLVDELRANPEVVLAFHERVIVDETDNVVATPGPLLAPGNTAFIDRPFLIEHMVAGLNNFIGEPSNIMLVRDRVDISAVWDYRSWVLDFTGDVAAYLNCAEKAPLLAVGGYLSASRRHSAQAPETGSANFSAGLYEWELMVRGEAAAGNLTGDALRNAQRTLRRLYANWSATLPEIAPLLANLDEFKRRPAHELYASERFQADLTNARAAVAARVGVSSKGPQAPQQKFCVVCEQPVPGWLPHPENGNSGKTFMRQIETVGSTLQNHSCPKCGCNDRERHLWLYLAFSRILEDAGAKRILHVAPEAGLEPRIRRLQPREYVVGDLSPRLAHHREINVEKLDFPDGYFDVIICNHVLEHVDNPAAALAEFNRCLAPGGHLVAQTPYSPVLRNTFELTKPVDEAFATNYFGQNDHVRMFGADLVDHFRNAGFKGDLYPHTTVLGEVDPDTYGCNGREPFFFFAKGDAPVFPAHASSQPIQ
ncbi:methyltransferase domain-containing protein [Trinickia violacea]|uniref:Methyltransferase domain-containing protein n=1 Tax=Trinickia violacea TaxID=2571746 RepID=A0A4P8ILQ6_9BURK|nr:methyltransferase domain-containing protein [Trinickia violacea]QCP47743.1 methyltransferase domain-containing protein [Trinickia violacea]